MKFETACIRMRTPQTHEKEHSSPLFLTSSFTFDSAREGADLFSGEQEGRLYSRFSNPNTDEFINKLKYLEGCEAGIATASGMSAVFVAMAAHLRSGDHCLCTREVFGNTHHVVEKILPGMGISHSYVAIDDPESWSAAVRPESKLLYVETPSNPTLKTADLEQLSAFCKAHDLILIVDNCFATPYLQQPAKFGADLVIHSATKYLDGQGRVLGGAILGHEDLIQPCYEFLRRTGPSLSPFNAWILSKSLELLPIRMEKHSQNALALAEFLQDHPAVTEVIYPHLPDYPQYDIARKQMRMGGGLVGCRLKGGLQEGRDFLDQLTLHSLTANLGDTRSIATHPASTTHSKLSEAQQREVGITASFIRFSVGLEHIDDIITDIDQSLSKTFS
jgi:O-succinylhomoserine sulfhydrylase